MDWSAERVTLLDGLSAEQRREIMASSITRTYPAGAQIIGDHDPGRDIFFLLSGRVVVRAFSEDGYEVSYAELSDGACFGEMSAIDGQPRASAIDALTVAVVARLDGLKFRACVARMPGLGLALAEMLVERARAMSVRIFEFSTLPVRARVRLELLRLARAGGTDIGPAVICPAPTHQEVAARVSTHREAVSRELGQMKAEGLVTASRQSIRIVSVAALRRSI
jgi:CRP/FNR family transcriptional regulator, cyclic AMP receptor protein